jgi:tetratricopeptide (TPR) repeat protein
MSMVTSSPTTAPATAKVLTPQAFTHRLFRLDMALLALVLILAFCLGSFRATNSDVFLHLALGSPFRAGADPSGWVHHAWLSSVLVGFLYEPFSASAETGGRFAVIAKALAVVGLTVVLVLVRRRGQSWLVPVACTGLAVLVMSPRLVLAPFVVSLLFLAVTLFVLTLPTSLHPRAVRWLPALFVVWVNMDEWFILGPLTVGLWMVGQWLQGRLNIPDAAPDKEHPPAMRDLTIALLGGLAVCILNPWGFRALTLPAELAAPLSGILPDTFVAAGRTMRLIQASDPQFAASSMPFSLDYIGRPASGSHVAGLAYLVLLALGVASFVLPAYFPGQPATTASRGPRGGFTATLFVVFLFYAALSVYDARMIALFAVVAGPISALNLQDYLRRVRPSLDRLVKTDVNWGHGSRFVALLVGVLLLVCAWPGWLHGQSDVWRATRHVAWGVVEDPSGLEAARVIRQIRDRTGLLKRSFNYSLEASEVFAWPNFRDESPAEDFFADTRLALFTRQATADGKLRNALREWAELAYVKTEGAIERMELDNRRGKAVGIYYGLLKEHGIDHVVFTNLHQDPEASKVAAALLANPPQWALLFNDGRTAIFGWCELKTPPTDPFSEVRLELVRLAPPQPFPPNVPKIKLQDPAPPPAPVTRSDWQEYLHGPRPAALGGVEAWQMIGLYGQAAQHVTELLPRDMIAVAVGCFGAAGTAAALGTTGPYTIRKDPNGQEMSTPWLLPRDKGPPAALVLAVRAGQNGVRESPQDAVTYYALGLAYNALNLEQEGYWVSRNPGPLFGQTARGPYRGTLRHQFRTAQALTALETAVLVDRSRWDIHLQLYDWYAKMYYFDVALDHLIRAREIVETQTKQRSKDQADLARKFKEDSEQLIKNFGGLVKRATEDYGLLAKAQPDALLRLDAALHARSRDESGKEIVAPRGLVMLALKNLMESKSSAYKGDPHKLRDFIYWQAFLLLTTGQGSEVNEWFKDEGLRKVLKEGEYEELRATAAAAIGDYATADKYLDLAEKARKQPADAAVLKQHVAELLAGRGSVSPGEDPFPGMMVRVAAIDLQQRDLHQELRDVAEVRLMRGLLALETGDLKAAKNHLRACLLLAPPRYEFPDRAVALRYLELLAAK